MKYIIWIYLLVCFSCYKEKPLNYYHGVVVDENSIPISGVIVKTDYVGSLRTKTKQNGYFKLSRKLNQYGSLIFSKEGYKTPQKRTIWTQSGELVDYSFIKKKIDTIIILKN